METRKILIASTKTQQRYELETAATTLGELQDEMTAKGIEFTGMSFTEGLSKTQLTNRSDLLPTNVMHKGQPTNNLVILLTNTTKKIESGAGTRKEAYEFIKEHDLSENIKNEFGRNFTQITTEQLWKYIDECNCVRENENESIPDCDEDDEEFEDPSNPAVVEYIYVTAKAALKDKIIDNADIKALIELFKELVDKKAEEEEADVYKYNLGDIDISDKDIDDMISSL